jgi:hypothetical protein
LRPPSPIPKGIREKTGSMEGNAVWPPNESCSEYPAINLSTIIGGRIPNRAIDISGSIRSSTKACAANFQSFQSVGKSERFGGTGRQGRGEVETCSGSSRYRRSSDAGRSLRHKDRPMRGRGVSASAGAACVAAEAARNERRSSFMASRLVSIVCRPYRELKDRTLRFICLGP